MKTLKKLSNNKFEKDSQISYDPLEVRYRPSPIWTQVLLCAIASSFGFGFIYACIARIDEVVIAKGELQALGAERPIKSPISGVINNILISEGDPVNKGSTLLTFNTEVLEAREESLTAKLDELKATLKNEGEIFKEISILADVGGIQKLQYLQQKNRLTELQFEIKQLKAKIKEVKFDAAKSNLISPVKGRVFNLIPSSPGYATTLGETLLKVVPDGDIEAKIFLSNSDIGFVNTNMEVQVRVDAYPFTQFGYIQGNLKSIGQEVLPADQQNPRPRFPAYVQLSKQFLEKDGNNYKIRSGQSVTVNLIVRDKPIISLLTDVLDKAFDSLRGIKS